MDLKLSFYFAKEDNQSWVIKGSSLYAVYTIMWGRYKWDINETNCFTHHTVRITDLDKFNLVEIRGRGQKRELTLM